MHLSTGVLLSFYYEPTAGGAYRSLKMIDTVVSYGWLFHKTHDLSGNAMIGVGLIQMVVMFLGRQFRKSWLTAWISGILFTLSAIALDWTAMLLDWTQEGYWRFSIELGTIEAIPLIGGELRDILTGGGAISTITVQHLYALNSYIISPIALLLAIVHLAALLWQEREISADETAEDAFQAPDASLVES
ncbi:hypothetical protein FDUTEX481_08201 [Tolypothrix sp. PCC 7601]|nr:hypothetical protein FDUTEX481_08201 [Tolypothrix sp. PCC 7601]